MNGMKIRTDGIAAPKRQNQILHGKGRREEEAGSRVGLLEVDDLGAGPAREIRGELEVHGGAAEGDDAAEHPVNHTEADRARAA